jgi:protein-S-isoprenylcysteine O-methyltransferase Ste14
MRRLVPPVLFLICLILMGLLRWLWPIRLLFPAPYHLLGVVPIVVGLVSGFSGMLQFRKAKTNLRPFVEADTLVTEGPFRYTRNPMYLGLALVLLGVWILMGVLSPFLGVLIFVVVADRFYIAFEEQMLQRKFGPAYEAYRVRTRRWI